MKLKEKRLPWWALAIMLIGFLIIAYMLIQRQNADLAMLERTYENVNARRILLQYEQSEMQQELNISSTADYIASRARENGYMMPNELHFVVDNPWVLTDHETVDEAHLTTVETPDAPEAQPEQAESQEPVTAEEAPQQESQSDPVPEEAEP